MLVFRWWFYQYYIKYAEQMNFHVIVYIDSQTEHEIKQEKLLNSREAFNPVLPVSHLDNLPAHSSPNSPRRGVMLSVDN
jgi:hypothetical protein